MDWIAIKNQIKAANEILAVVAEHMTLTPDGPTFKGECPFCKGSFDVDPRRQRYRCWTCNKYGDVITFVQEFQKVSFQEAIEMLIEKEKERLAPLLSDLKGMVAAYPDEVRDLLAGTVTPMLAGVKASERAAAGIVFRACIDMAAANQPIDLITLANHLNKAGKLDAVGGPRYLADLWDAGL